MSNVIEAREYICTREKYLEVKELQKKVAATLKSERQALADYYQRRRKFYTALGIPIGNPDWNYDYKLDKYVSKYMKDGWTEPFPKEVYPEINARGLNIVYGMLKGKAYKQIEQKYREGNEPLYHVLSTCKDLNLDQDTITKIREEVENG